jgi:hypothetical protein
MKKQKTEDQLRQDRIYKFGLQLKRSLEPIASKKYGFFDWQYVGGDPGDLTVDYEFYFNHIIPKSIRFLKTFFTIYSEFEPKIVGGVHDKAFQKHDWQICIRLTANVKKIMNPEDDYYC